MLTKSLHQALEYLYWLDKYLERHPTRLCELITLHPTLDGYRNMSGHICGGEFLTGATAVTWTL